MSRLSPEEWEAWRDHPVTQLIRDLLARQLARKREYLKDRWLQGQSPSEGERLAILGLGEWHDDFFTLTHSELMAAIEDE